MHRWSSKKDEGFTLVELMVVVLIIGILVAIAIPVFNLAAANARERACQASMRTVESAIAQYDATNVDTPFVRTGAGANTIADLTPDFIQVTPTCGEGGVYSFGGTNDIITCSEPTHGDVQ